MGAAMRPELSKKNKYWIDKYRYYELKYFCLQYPTWKDLYLQTDGLDARSLDILGSSKTNVISDPTARCAEVRTFYLERMKLVEQAAIQTDPELSTYILRAVTEELSYTQLKSRLEIPCSKDTYYDRYRRFFWVLSQAKNYI